MDTVPQAKITRHLRNERDPKPGLVNITRDDDRVNVIVTDGVQPFKVLVAFSLPADAWDQLVKEASQLCVSGGGSGLAHSA